MVSLDDFEPVYRASNMFGKYCRYLKAGDGAEAQSQVTWACFLLANDPLWFINYGDSFVKPSSPSLQGYFNFELPVCFCLDDDRGRLTHPLPTFLPQQLPHMFTKTSDRYDTLPGEKSSCKNHNQVSSFGRCFQDPDRLWANQIIWNSFFQQKNPRFGWVFHKNHVKKSGKNPQMLDDVSSPCSPYLFPPSTHRVDPASNLLQGHFQGTNQIRRVLPAPRNWLQLGIQRTSKN